MVGAAVALLTVPVTLAIGQDRAVRHSGMSCYLSAGFAQTALADLYAGPGTGTQHDWGIGNLKPSEGVVAYCPVTLDVPRDEKNPIQRVRIAYSTRESPVLGVIPAGYSPVIQSCTAFLMDGTGNGTWVASTDPTTGPAGPPTASIYGDSFITIDNATVPLGSTSSLRRMLITCTLPKGVLISGTTNYTYTALIKGYEVQYQVSP
jgi:hypothetical protein